jgi:hypothetical protein
VRGLESEDALAGVLDRQSAPLEERTVPRRLPLDGGDGTGHL